LIEAKHTVYKGGKECDLERESHVHEERVLDVLQDVALGGGVFQLVPLHQGLLPQGLHRVELPLGAFVFLAAKHHFPEAAAAQHLSPSESGSTRFGAPLHV